MRIVVDTNVIVSAMFWGGKPRTLVDSARVGLFEVVASSELLAELREVAGRRKFKAKLDAIDRPLDELIERDFTSFATFAEPTLIVRVVPNDPDDDAVIACAVAAQADYIISGDDHLLSMGQYQGITILGVDDFVNVILPTLPQ